MYREDNIWLVRLYTVYEIRRINISYKQRSTRPRLWPSDIYVIKGELTCL
jgi:hypothetical protein